MIIEPEIIVNYFKDTEQKKTLPILQPHPTSNKERL